MTVLQHIIRNNLELSKLSNSVTEASHLREIIKKVKNVVEISIITLGSMFLSFYLMFLR